MKFKAITYVVVFILLPSIASAQLVKKDATAARNYFDESGTMRIAIAKQLQVPEDSVGRIMFRLVAIAELMEEMVSLLFPKYA